MGAVAGKYESRASSTAALTTEEHFEQILRSQARLRSAQGPWHGHMAEIILKTEGFLELTMPKVLEFLSDDRLPVNSELHTFDSAITWFLQNLRKINMSQPSPRLRAQTHGKTLVALMVGVPRSLLRCGALDSVNWEELLLSSVCRKSDGIVAEDDEWLRSDP